jgi:hypothetical protein
MSEVEVYDVGLVDYELNELSVFLDVMEKSISLYEDEMETRYSIADLERIDENQESQMEYEKYIDEFSSVVFNIPRRLYMSFVVNWYSFVEEGLLKICRSVGIFNYDEAEPFSGSGLRTAKNVIHANTNIKSDNPVWEEIEEIRLLRNNIVHKNGFIPFDNKRKILTFFEDHAIGIPRRQLIYLEKHKLIFANPNFCFISPSKDYCSHLLDYGKRIFDAVFYEFNLRSFPGKD